MLMSNHPYSRLVISGCIDSVSAGGDSQYPLYFNLAGCMFDVQDQKI